MTAGDHSRPRYRWYVLLVIALVLAILATVGGWNYRLNPLAYDRGHLRAVAASLATGQNYANYDTNINWRALRREQIKLMTATPEVIVFGGSRWWEAHADLVPGRIFFNAWVSNDQAEDAMALAQQLDQAGRLPKTLILSLRFISFQPPAEREAAEWQEWAPEYRQLAGRLGIRAHSYLETLPVRTWSGMFYAPAVYDRELQQAANPAVPGPTVEPQQPTMEIISTDGSILWSRKSTAKFTTQFVDKAVRAELTKVGNTAPKIDRSLVDALAKTIEFLQAKGVRVVLAQTPYHPAFYAEIQKRPFGRTLNGLESIAVDMKRRFGVISVGGYDPATLGCVPQDYIDHIHSKPSCLARVLRQVPDLAQGS